MPRHNGGVVREQVSRSLWGPLRGLRARKIIEKSQYGRVYDRIPFKTQYIGLLMP